MPVIKVTRPRVFIALGFTVICLLAGVLWYLSTTESVSRYPMKDYTAETQEKAAKSIVAGLNTHNPDNVDLMRNHSGDPDRDADNAQITENIAAVLPSAGCRYNLASIEDQGEQDPGAVPWFSGPTQARGFDMKLQQLCLGQAPTPRTIRVIAIPSGMGGYWGEAALENED
jgi:hypothetical protein